jgi:hypothetical protein
MRIDQGLMVPLRYGKFFKSDCIPGLAPVEEDRGSGKRTLVYIDALEEPLTASRSENAILRDLTGAPRELAKGQEQQQLLADIRDTISGINPVLRAIIRDQGKWDLDRLEDLLQDILGDDKAAST